MFGKFESLLRAFPSFFSHLPRFDNSRPFSYFFGRLTNERPPYLPLRRGERLIYLARFHRPNIPTWMLARFPVTSWWLAVASTFLVNFFFLWSAGLWLFSVDVCLPPSLGRTDIFSLRPAYCRPRRVFLVSYTSFIILFVRFLSFLRGEGQVFKNPLRDRPPRCFFFTLPVERLLASGRPTPFNPLAHTLLRSGLVLLPGTLSSPVSLAAQLS